MSSPSSNANRSRLLLTASGGVLWSGVLFVLGPHDLRVSVAFADHEHWYGELIQSYGTLPALVGYLLAIGVLLVRRWRERSELLARASAAVLAQALLHTLAITSRSYGAASASHSHPGCPSTRCSWMSVVPRSSAETGPRTVLTVAIVPPPATVGAGRV